MLFRKILIQRRRKRELIILAENPNFAVELLEMAKFSKNKSLAKMEYIPYIYTVYILLN